MPNACWGSAAPLGARSSVQFHARRCSAVTQRANGPNRPFLSSATSVLNNADPNTLSCCTQDGQGLQAHPASWLAHQRSGQLDQKAAATWQPTRRSSQVRRGRRRRCRRTLCFPSRGSSSLPSLCLLGTARPHGIGRACARAFVRAGYRVLGIDRLRLQDGEAGGCCGWEPALV